MNSITIGDRKVFPSKIICVGRNYVDHIEELGNEMPEDIVIFMKPNSAVSSKLISFHEEQIHYEGEISFLYENGRFSAAGFGLDLTKRELQGKLKAKGLPWERAKAFDNSALFSGFVKIENTGNISLLLEINGNTVQSSGTGYMIYRPEVILTEIRKFLTLFDGDIVMTGTPKGVGIIKKGDLFKGTLKTGDKELISAQWKAQ
ncbi:MAG: fumarylacetoacetate hydrolase family protein [Spirochaetales bacterium]|nr:fumarylacetoacetate hydrolase family protein [Spirochaetales bacterium]